MENKGLNKLPVPTGWQCGWPGLCSHAASLPSPLGVSAADCAGVSMAHLSNIITLTKKPEKMTLSGFKLLQNGYDLKRKIFFLTGWLLL